MNLKEKNAKMKSLLIAITEQNKITAEFLARNDILRAKKSVIQAGEIIDEFNKVMFS